MAWDIGALPHVLLASKSASVVRPSRFMNRKLQSPKAFTSPVLKMSFSVFKQAMLSPPHMYKSRVGFLVTFDAAKTCLGSHEQGCMEITQHNAVISSHINLMDEGLQP